MGARRAGRGKERRERRKESSAQLSSDVERRAKGEERREERARKDT